MFEDTRWRFSIPSIAIPYLLLVLVTMIGLWMYVLGLMRATFQTGVVDRLAAQARMIGDTVEQSLASYQPIDVFDPIADRYALLTSSRVTIIGRDGTVLGESGEDSQVLAEYSENSFPISRPEIQDALAKGIGIAIQKSGSQQRQFIYVAVPVSVENQPRAFIRLALPVSTIESEVMPRQVTLSLIFVGITLLSLLLVVLVSERTAYPLRELTRMANQLAEGSFLPHTPAGRKDETGVLAVAFGRLNFQLRNQLRGLEQRIVTQTKSLDQRSSHLELTAEVARQMSRNRDLDALLPAVVQMIRDRLGFYFVSVYTLDEQNRFAIFRTGTGEAGQTMLQNDFRVTVGGSGLIGYVSGSGEARMNNNVMADFTHVRNLLLPDTRSELAIPIKVGARVLGVLDFQCKSENAFDEDLLSILKTVADQLAVSIQHARLREEVQADLQETNRLSVRLAQSSWTDRGSGTIAYDYDLNQVRSTERNLDYEVVEKLKAGQSVVVQNPGGSATHISDSHFQKSQLFTPLMVYGQMVGVVGLEENDPKREWTPEERTLVEAITGQVALALDNARLVEETQYRSEQLRLLQEVTATAAAYVELDKLLDNVSQKLVSGFNVAQCSVALFNMDETQPSASMLVTRYATDGSGAPRSPNRPGAALADGFQTPTAGETQPESGLLSPDLSLTQSDLAFLQNVLQARRANVIYDIQNHPQAIWRAELAAHGIRTLVIIPLLSRGDLVGAILMGVADHERHFDENTLDLLDQIGLQISSAIEVARSFEETLHRAEYERQISEMTTRIRETLDIETVLSTAADEIYKAGNLDEVIVQLVSS